MEKSVGLQTIVWYIPPPPPRPLTSKSNSITIYTNDRQMCINGRRTVRTEGKKDTLNNVYSRPSASRSAKVSRRKSQSGQVKSTHRKEDKQKKELIKRGTTPLKLLN